MHNSSLLIRSGEKMNSSTRACVAFIVGASKKSSINSIYDYSQSKHINVSGTVNEDTVNVYDHDRGCHVTGNLSSFYDYGNNAHINLNININQFTGYDYGSSSHYSGSFNSNSVSIYDYETSQHYNYNL